MSSRMIVGVAALWLALAMMGALAPKAAASERDPSQAQTEKDRAVVPLQDGIKLPGEMSQAMWVWPSGRRLYVLGDLSNGISNASPGGYRKLHAFHVDGVGSPGQMTLSPPAWHSGVPPQYTTGQPHSMAIDDKGGRLFIPYSSYAPNPTGVLGGDAQQRLVPSLAVNGAAEGRVCYLGAASALIPCMGGLHVADAESLTPLGRIDLQSVRVDGLTLGVIPRAISYAPPRGEGDGGKVLVLLEDLSVNTSEGAGVPPGVPVPLGPRSRGAALVYAAQFDPDAMRLDWIVRVEACRGSREQPFPGQTHHNARPYPAAIFRSADVMRPAVWVGCHGPNETGTAVRIPLDSSGTPAGLPVFVSDPGEAASGGVVDGPPSGRSAPVGQAEAQLAVPGPDKVSEIIADPVSARLLMKVNAGTPTAEVWWVFDARAGRFVGTIGIGPYDGATKLTDASLDPQTGRLYVFGAPLTSGPGAGFTGGLFVADVRREPLGQAVVFPEFAGSLDGPAVSMARTPEDGGGRLVLYRRDNRTVSMLWDRLPVAEQMVSGEAFAGRTLDLDEVEGMTSSVLDGAARGYGARSILVTGLEAAARVGPADPIGQLFMPHGVIGVQEWYPMTGVPEQHGCFQNDREVVLGSVGRSGAVVVDAAGSRGAAEPVVIDSGTRADTEAAVTRCSTKEWESLWGNALFGRPLVSEPSAPWVFGADQASCESNGESPSGRTGDPVLGAFSAGVDCGGEDASGFSYVRGAQLEGTHVAEALSSFRIYRDPGRGVVSRVESVARGIDVGGLIKISTVRGAAESWANGRANPVADADREAGYDPNCDRERTAGTCHERHVFGVRSPAYSCGPCGDEKRLIEGLSRALGANGSVNFRSPDPVLARGADNGFIAAVQKPDGERFSDMVLNNDLLQTVVPTLEIIRVAPPNRYPNSGGTRGRQVLQFAGVEVASSYAISCLLVFDEATNTCAAEQEEPGGITISLTDAAGESLAGGAFEVRTDTEADGVLGLADTLLPGGACVTADDGVGTCTFDGLAPGGYLVSQVAAPPGYAKAAEPYLVELASGEARTVAFTNVSNVSTVELNAADEHGAPLSGAAFAAYPDPDADGKIAPDATPTAQCTTDATGTCTMKLPAGSYVLAQTSAPDGLESVEPVAFTFATGGQIAAVTIVNYPPDQPGAPDAAPAPIHYTPPVDVAPAIQSVTGYQPLDTAQPPDIAPPVSIPDQVGGTITRVIRAPGDALRLLARDPQQATAFTAALTLLALALIAIRRQQHLGTLTATPALAFHGGTPHPPGPTRPVSSTRPHGPGTPGTSRSPGHRPGRPAQGGSGRDSLGPRAASGSPAAPANANSSAPSRGTTAVLERPVVAGSAPSVTEGPTLAVVAATASAPLRTIIANRLEQSPKCRLEGMAANVDELKAIIGTTHPDVVVVDLALPTGSSQDVCDILRDLHPPERTLGLIPPGRAVDALVSRGFSAGLQGLLVAHDDLGNGHLAYAISCLAAGRPCFGPTVQAILLQHAPRPRASRGKPVLSDRELEVARLAAQGAGRAEIAEVLYLSPWTVKRHMVQIRAKLGVTNPYDRAQLSLRLAELGLLAEQADNPRD